MNQNILTYLQQNKDKYPKELLIAQLLKGGYGQQEIQEAADFIYDAKIKNIVRSDFWDFKAVKTYTMSSEKWKDFLFGFFAPFIVRIVGNIIPVIGSILTLVFYIIALVYLFNRRKFVFYGVVINFVAMLIITVVVLISIFGIKASF
ncbi:MAG: hypothetical protein ACD_9C00236G0001 [uncultured bacterium]|nr:MAG: hypothetical protein ACD_9C00236G0001 [uncultured bacterium]